MTIAELLPDISKLDPAERWELANKIWEEVEAENSAFPVREDHMAILEERWKEFKEAPENTTSWDDIKKRIGKN